MLTIPGGDVSLKKLPQPVAASQIKKLVYKFNQKIDGKCEIEINDVDCSTVMLRGDASNFDEAWTLLLALNGQFSNGENAEPDADTAVLASFSFKPGKEYWRPSAVVDSAIVKRYDDGRLYLVGAGARLLEAVDALVMPFAKQEKATHFYAEPIWHEDELSSFGYPVNAKDLCRIGHFDEQSRDYWQNATCDNIWKSLKRETIDQPRVFTTIGTCCRNESRNYYFLERLKTFRMREIVMAGTAEDVLRFRERALAFVGELARLCCLDAVIEQANDPFFLEDGVSVNDVSAELELPECVKYEFRPALYDGKSMACASFNVHGNFFSKEFQYVNLAGRRVWTSCAAFGIERWVWAILIQHGTDPAYWPLSLRGLVAAEPGVVAG